LPPILALPGDGGLFEWLRGPAALDGGADDPGSGAEPVPMPPVVPSAWASAGRASTAAAAIMAVVERRRI